ncbi:MAG: decaprenyl-phosphate phosphoribosyltransferase [candidate division NC10 bacterium]|nr:decaprenyl-phosphate phosphoribosyltransferase [candidate division NC10 bacterium]
MLLKAVFLSIRPKQWTKNFIVFAGLIFSENLFNQPLFLKTLAAFFLFCLLSGSIYIINDLRDIEGDRLHPEKRKRPIASSELPPLPATIAASTLALVSLSLSFWLSSKFGLVALAYFLLLMAYSFVLKDHVLLDVMVLSFGFLLRAVAGALVIDVRISPWLIVCTLLLAMFLALAKRRHELVVLGDNAGQGRPVLSEYNPLLLDQMIAVVAAAAIIAYSLYSISEATVGRFKTTNLSLTIPFVIYGIFRYLYLVYRKELGGNPSRLLLHDRPLLINILLWIGAVVIIIYFGR